MKDYVLDRISKDGIIPVVKFEKAGDAVPAAKTLYEGGLGCVEVTFRTDCASAAIKQIAEEFPETMYSESERLTQTSPRGN